MMRRLLDILVAALGLSLFAFPLGVILFLVWRQDGHSPFYVADRAGMGGVPFRMVKIRSMIINAHQNGVESTSVSDNRITPLGHFIRRWKIDELSQLWNVLKGDMSLVGPRPNTINEVATYSNAERSLLSVRPGITDFSSIVFSDEGDILKDSANPDADYTRLIRPWKSQLGLLYASNATLLLNVQLISLTVLAIANKHAALGLLQRLLASAGANLELLEVAKRKQALDSFSATAEG
jgi:lipopolysaccharide/colanic/teichoic acid biosynthesis glycosyltransferase